MRSNRCIIELQSQAEPGLTDNEVSAMHNKCFMELLYYNQPVSTTTEVKSLHD